MIEILGSTQAMGAEFAVASINPQLVMSNIGTCVHVLDTNLRRLIRAAPGTDDRLDVYVIYMFNEFGGLGVLAHSDLAADYRPDSPLRWACFVDGLAWDSPGNYPWIYPHEAGHVLSQAFHIHSGDRHGTACLMKGGELSQHDPVDATKRIFDHPLTVRCECWDPAQPSPGAADFDVFSMNERFRQKGSSVLEDWT